MSRQSTERKNRIFPCLQGASHGLDLSAPEVDEDGGADGGGADQLVVVPTWADIFDDKLSDLFGYVGTAEKAELLLKEYERATMSHFVPQKLSRELGTSGKALLCTVYSSP